VVTVKGSDDLGKLDASERIFGKRDEREGRGGESVRYVMLSAGMEVV
jgi:hypothetical protein